MADYADGVLLFQISEDSIWNAATRDSLALMRYYDERAADYHFPERHRVIGFYSRNDSLLQVAAAALDAGQDPAVIEALVADAEQAIRIDTVFIAEATGSFFDRALELGVGERTNVLPYQSRRALLLHDAIEPPRRKTFEEARAQVVADYQDVLDERLRARLREEYGAETYPERLRSAFEDAAAMNAAAAGDAAGDAAADTE
jgi:peptidyl-prolyl cis-trans isomerase SurA